MVVGPSGSGKSSLLRAGLLPAIAAGALPARGAQAWPLDLMTPGRRPLLELATRIAALAGVSAGELDANLHTDPTRITAPIRQALLAHARHQAPSLRARPRGPPAAVINVEATGHLADGATPAAGANREPVDSSPRLVLIVDQFEEVFTQCPDEQRAPGLYRGAVRRRGCRGGTRRLTAAARPGRCSGRGMRRRWW